MELVINNKVINAPIMTILTTLKGEIHNGLLKDIERETQDNIPITCPSHKNGREHKPSCFVYCRKDNDNVEYGRVHCFTCGYSVDLPTFVGDCFGATKEFGEKWLLSKFGTNLDYSIDYLEPINLDIPKKEFLDENILNNYIWIFKFENISNITQKFSIF
jgi:hypothetical protein